MGPVLGELLRGQLRLVEVAAGQPGAADEELAGDTDGDRAVVPVHHVDLGVGHRAADRGERVAGGDLGGGGQHGRLGGPVEVDDPERQVDSGRQAQLVAAGGDVLDAAAVPGEGREGLQHRGGQEGAADVLVLEPLLEQGGGEADGVGGDAAGGSGGQGGPELQGGGVEGDPGEQGDPVPRFQREGVERPVDEVDEAAVLDLDALGPAGRA